MMLLFSILQWFLLGVLIIVFLLLLLWMWTGFWAKVPFIPVPNAVLPDIARALNVAEGSVVYDLGCGEGRVLFYLSKHIPKAQYVGIENSPFPLLLARVRAMWHRKVTRRTIDIRNQDFFNHDLSSATHIFTYLYPHVMDDLLKKFDRELKPGTRLVSVSFKFTVKQPVAEYILSRNKYQLAQKLYVYEF